MSLAFKNAEKSTGGENCPCCNTWVCKYNGQHLKNVGVCADTQVLQNVFPWTFGTGYYHRRVVPLPFHMVQDSMKKAGKVDAWQRTVENETLFWEIVDGVE